MFKKLLSNLPFNPSLIGQVSFYAQRLHNEAALRRLGVIVLLLSMVVQLFAVITPPEPTLARSGNDIIEGGFTTRDQAVLHCLNPERDFLKILQYYGIGCDTLAKAETVTLKSTDYEKKLDSMGRWAQGPTITRTNKPTNEYSVTISGNTYYMRNLWAWDSGTASTYKFLRMKNKDGIIIMVMYSCGNIVTIDRYSPPVVPEAPATVKKPKLEIRKDNTPGAMVSIGEEITYSLFYRNSGSATATKVRIKDSVPNNTELVSVDPGGNRHSISSNRRSIEFWHNVPQEAVGYSAHWHVVRYKVKVTRMPSGNNSICNTARIESDQQDVDSNEVCNFVRPPATTQTSSSPTRRSTPPALPDTPSTPGSVTTTLNKKARNVTQNIADASGTTAKAGDEIQYVLLVKNTGNLTAKDFVIEESMGDVLEYADLKSLDGGIIDDNKVIRWEPIDISPGETISRNIIVKIKDPIPNTPVSISHRGSFDLTMTNVYGDTVNIKLPTTPLKTTEQTVQQLPNTGPGESMAMMVLLTIAVSYFFARSRLMAKELDIVRSDFAASGGY
jgi:uncharacterized repeat protein (TIGR01451 family)